MTAGDGTLWALAFAIVVITAAITWLLIRCAGTVGRVNKILDDTSKEAPATLASVRKMVQNAEQVSADLAATTAVVRDGAESARLLVDRFGSAVKFLDENVFSKLSALAPIIAMVGGFLGKFVGSRLGGGDAAAKPDETKPDAGS
jgi:hypothetical protein